MELFNQFVIPPSESYLELLRLLMVLCLSVSMPYLGILLAGTMVSMGFSYRDRDIPNATFARFAKDIMGMVAPNNMVVFVLGVAPEVDLEAAEVRRDDGAREDGRDDPAEAVDGEGCGGGGGLHDGSSVHR